MMNSLCSICVGLQNGISMDDIIDGITEFELTKGRMEIIDRNDDVKIINDSYNAGYDSMKAALEALNATKANRKIAILGDILELGDFAKEIHEKVGEEVYKNNLDALITVGENAKYIAKNATKLGMNECKIFMFDTNEEAINKIESILKSGDCVLVKASWGMKFREIVERMISL